MKTKSQAFTLVELLAVIGTVAVLAALLVPIIGATRTTSRTAQCMSNLRMLAQGAQLWIADHRGHLPDANLWQSSSGDYSLRPYLGVSANSAADRQSVFTCPEAYQRHPDPESGLTDNFRTYSINLYACRTQNGDITDDVKSNPQTLSGVPTPSKTSLFMDGDLITATTSVRRYVHSGMAAPSSIWTPEKPYGLLAVHRGRLNVAFIDGHVESLHPSGLPSTASEGSVTKAQKHPFWGRFPQ